MQVLGVKARETGRAASQQAFIKANCHEARISITLWNEGPEAYLPDVFGDEIIIDRRIGKTASYSIKSATGRKIGHRREDLDAVLDALQINAANPITVMTQVRRMPFSMLCTSSTYSIIGQQILLLSDLTIDCMH